ncbi:unnamed protein product [Blepharisma stoltei]|uniref:Nudix hydrolase domain-containing protein n=1 Tax=Blepharisma stoltei TaxID=1481888 RepID=A0AAU9KQR6_9CILI|nr:unnamed protein product [Blepharisma stoltei]
MLEECKNDRLASSLVLCRLYNRNFQVLMIKRKSSMSFSSSYVFPGGTFDKEDADPRWSQLIQQKSEEIPETSYSKKINLQDAKVTAIRETWEEVGVLLADRQINKTKNGKEFLDECLRENSRPQIEKLVYITRFITPIGFQPRFDNIMFLAVAKNDTEVVIGTDESDDYLWAEPQEILDMYQRREILIWPPQASVLTTLARFKTLDKVISFLKALKKIPHMPEIIQGDSCVFYGDYRYTRTPEIIKQKKLIHMLDLAGRKVSMQISPEIVDFLTNLSPKL